MDCNCKKNQTHPDVIKHVIDKKLDVSRTEGFGIFLVPAPEKGILEVKTVVVENVSFRECVKRGANCIAHQWVPRGFEWTHTTSDGQSHAFRFDSKADIEKAQMFCSQDEHICPDSVCKLPVCMCDSGFCVPAFQP